MPGVECRNRRFNVKVEVGKVTPSDFQSAVKYYCKEENFLLDKEPSKEMYLYGRVFPVYQVTFACLDFSANHESTDFTEIQLFSHDKAGRDWIPRVKLS
jgi:hypothetical protein